MANRQHGYVQQRIGELEHHAFFGEFPEAFLVYHNMRIRAGHMDGCVDTNVEEVSRLCNLKQRVVRRAIKWLSEGDVMILRPAYIERIRHGNQHRLSLWRVLKYATTRLDPLKSNDPPGVLAQQSGLKSNGRPGVLALKSNGRPGVTALKSNGRPGVIADRQATETQGVTGYNTRVREEEEFKTNLLRVDDSSGGQFQQKVFHCKNCRSTIRALAEHPVLERIAPELGAAIFHAGKFTTPIRHTIGNEYSAGFAKKRKMPNATAIDFIRYARSRMIRATTYAARNGHLVLNGNRCKHNTKRFQLWIDTEIHGRWKAVEAAISSFESGAH